MSKNRTIPVKDADFNVWQEIVSTEVEEKSTVWGLDKAWLDNSFRPSCAKWNLAWAKYENPATRTPIITGDKNEARVIYEKFLTVLVGNLKVNTLVTDSERRALGINIRDSKPTPAPVPVSFPVATLDTSVTMRIGISFRDSESNTAAKPKGIHGAEIKWSIADEKPLTEDLANSAFDTRTPYTLDFADAQRGKTVWIRLRWENTRGEKGPWGNMESAIVP